MPEPAIGSAEMTPGEVLLDTNAVSDFLLHRSETLTRRATAYMAERGKLTTSTLTIFEVARGFYRVNQPHRVLAFRGRMDRWEVLPFDTEAADLAGRIESELLRNGTPIELADIFIAAVAIAHGRALVTRNTRHFEPIAALGFTLPLQDWTSSP